MSESTVHPADAASGDSSRARHGRLFLGYGPGIFLTVAFLMMALLVPSKAPEQTAADLGSTVPGGAPGSATAPGASNLDPATGVPPGSTGTAGQPGSSGSTGGSSSVGVCAGKQVKNDPYSPRCVKFKGANPGATAPGVSKTEIVVTYRHPVGGQSAAQALNQLSGNYNSTVFDDSPEQIERTVLDLATYFNKNFEFYGRKLVVKPFEGTGDLIREILNSGQSAANADALTAAKTKGAFADISSITQPYAEALAARKVINIGAPYMSDAWFAQRAPYSWSTFPSCTDLAAAGSAITVKQLINQKTTWAGEGVGNGKTRRFALIAPDGPIYQQCAAIVSTAMKNAGHPITANLSYSLNISQLSQQANSIEQQLVNKDITTVLYAGDPILLVYLTNNLDSAGYQPEFANVGAGYTDIDTVAQLFQQKSWAHAAGVTSNGTIPPYGSSIGYFAVKSVDPGFAPASQIDNLYSQMYMLALGIQLAGPNLTPATFQSGLFNYAGGNGQFGPWSFRKGSQGAHTPQRQFRYEWWNPNARSALNNQPGAWVVGSRWYSPTTVPPGPAPVFPDGPQ